MNFCKSTRNFATIKEIKEVEIKFINQPREKMKKNLNLINDEQLIRKSRIKNPCSSNTMRNIQDSNYKI